jgi:hypothetical protein
MVGATFITSVLRSSDNRYELKRLPGACLVSYRRHMVDNLGQRQAFGSERLGAFDRARHSLDMRLPALDFDAGRALALGAALETRLR